VTTTWSALQDKPQNLLKVMPTGKVFTALLRRSGSAGIPLSFGQHGEKSMTRRHHHIDMNQID
jgi:hypothetical protein